MLLQERQFVIDNLNSSEQRLLELVNGLSRAQWHFHESPERWSIAENVEHCILVEGAVTRVICAALNHPAEPEKKVAAPAKEPFVLGVAGRVRKLEALEALRPTGRWPDAEEMVRKLRTLRAQSLAFAQQTDADLRNHFLPHQALGDLDCYQWMVVMALHGARHAAQIEAIKADPNYPAA